MSGISGVLAGVAGVFSATITVGTDGANERGYDSFAGLYGALSPSNFNGHTISGLTWNINASGHIKLYLSGTSISNTDATFNRLQIAGLGFVTRASAGYTANDGAGHTLWTWTLSTLSYPNSGSANLQMA